MFKVILYVCIILIIIHATIYYFNLDVIGLKGKKNDTHITVSNDLSNDLSNSIDTSQINESINESINELKTLNECINNGKINTSFSQD